MTRKKSAVKEFLMLLGSIESLEELRERKRVYSRAVKPWNMFLVLSFPLESNIFHFKLLEILTN
jgi:hypothetical protein